MEAAESYVQGHPKLCDESAAIQGYLPRPCLKKREEKKKKKERKISYENNAHDTTSIYSMPNSILKCMLAQKMVEMERP